MSSILEPPPKTRWNVMSMGYGVQSSAIGLGIVDVSSIDFGVWADTGDEPQSVMRWIAKMEDKWQFPIYRVAKGVLSEDSLKVHQRKDGSGERVNNLIPAFGILPDGTKTAAIGRKCTNDYKILPIIHFVRDKCGIKRGQKETTVTMWMGISWDEIQRIKDPRFPWIQHRYPLIEKKIRRRDCEQFVFDKVGEYPPRSACYYCPFHSDTEWRRLRDEEPEEFNKAVLFDTALRLSHKYHNKRLKMEVYLHNSCTPLGEIDFDNDEDKGQMTWDFNAECEGMCGL